MNLGRQACVKYAEDGMTRSEAKTELGFFFLLLGFLERIIITTLCTQTWGNS